MKISSNFHNSKKGITKAPPKLNFFLAAEKYVEFVKTISLALA